MPSYGEMLSITRMYPHIWGSNFASNRICGVQKKGIYEPDSLTLGDEFVKVRGLKDSDIFRPVKTKKLVRRVTFC